MKLYIALILAFVLSGSITAQPDWYFHPETSGVKLKNYIIGLGTGKNYEDARAKASAEIASQLHVNVQSKSSIKSKERLENDVFNLSQDMQTTITLSVNETVNGLETLKQAAEGQEHFVLLGLNKNKYMFALRSKLQVLWKTIASLNNSAVESQEHNSVLQALESYTEMIPLLKSFSVNKDIYEAISPIPFLLTDAIDLYSVESSIRSLLRNLKIESLTRKKPRAHVGSAFEQPLTFRVSYTNDIPLYRIPVTIRYGDGSKISQSLTDANGKILVRPLALPLKRRERAIVASIDLPPLLSRWKKHLDNGSARTDYSVQTSGKKNIVVLKLDSESEQGRLLQKHISKQLNKFGFKVEEKGPFILDGEINQVSEKNFNGPSGDKVLIVSELILTLENEGDVLGSISARGKGLGKSSKQALIKSYKDLELNAKEFLELVNERKKS